MITELEMVKAENVTAEEEQLTILESISTTEKEVYTAYRELTEVRAHSSSQDI